MVWTPVLVLLAAFGGAVHEIQAGDSPQYSPPGLRVAAGDTVRWDATARHPLAFDGESAGPYDSGVHERTLLTPGRVAFHCTAHGSPGGVGMSGLVTVGDANQPPTIALERETAEPRAGELVVFRALPHDPERIAARVTWDLDGDGRFDAQLGGVSAAARYGPGVHTVHARVTDDLGLTADDRLTFTIPAAQSPTPPETSAPPGPPPVTAAPALRVRVNRTIRLAALRRRGLRVVVTSGTLGRVAVELRDRRGRRLVRVTASARADVPVAVRLRTARARPGRARLVVAATGGRVISRPLTVRP